MLRVTALELGDPVELLVQMEADDAAGDAGSGARIGLHGSLGPNEKASGAGSRCEPEE